VRQDLTQYRNLGMRVIKADSRWTRRVNELCVSRNLDQNG